MKKYTGYLASLLMLASVGSSMVGAEARDKKTEASVRSDIEEKLARYLQLDRSEPFTRLVDGEPSEWRNTINGFGEQNISAYDGLRTKPDLGRRAKQKFWAGLLGVVDYFERGVNNAGDEEGLNAEIRLLVSLLDSAVRNPEMQLHVAFTVYALEQILSERIGENENALYSLKSFVRPALLQELQAVANRLKDVLGAARARAFVEG